MNKLSEYFLFRFQLQARQSENLPVSPETLDLKYRVPLVERFPLPKNLPPTPREPMFDFRIGWSMKGLYLTAILSGKQTSLYCTSREVETSDGLSFFFDTRDIRDLHRATKYCHRFFFLPADSSVSNRSSEPSAVWLPIHRAKGSPKPIDTSLFQLASELRPDGWAFSAFIPGYLLTGYEPNEFPRAGFWFSLFDNELGHFNLQHSPTFPASDDPSLWSTLDLIPS